jgi:hypothetical protein
MGKAKESLTLRFDKDALKSLRSRAERDGLSLNSLINNIIIEHEEWHQIAATAGMFYIPKTVVRYLMDGASDEKLAKLAALTFEKETKRRTVVFKKSFDLDSFLWVIETWARISRFHVERSDDGVYAKVTIVHGVNERFSFYMKEYLSTVFGRLGCRKVAIDIGDDAFSFALEKRVVTNDDLFSAHDQPNA